MFKRVLLVSALLSVQVVAQDVPQAPKELIDELKAYCTDIAQEDGVEASEMQAFILKCVNAELSSEGYAQVEKI